MSIERRTELENIAKELYYGKKVVEAIHNCPLTAEGEIKAENILYDARNRDL